MTDIINMKRTYYQKLQEWLAGGHKKTADYPRRSTMRENVLIAAFWIERVSKFSLF